MLQKGKARKHLTQVQGDCNRTNTNSLEVNLFNGLGLNRLLTALFTNVRDFFQKGKVISRLRKEISEKDMEISRLNSDIMARLDSMFEARQKALAIKPMLEEALIEVSNKGQIDRSTYSSLQELLGAITEFQETDLDEKACAFAGTWVGERSEYWIQMVVDRVVAQHYQHFSTEDIIFVRQDLRMYLNWLHECLLVYTQPLYGKLKNINQNRQIKSPFIYRDIFEYIQVSGDFGSLSSREIYWLEAMILKLKENL